MNEPARVRLDDFNTVADLTVDYTDDETQRSSWTPILLTTLPEKPPVEPTLGEVGLVYPGKRHIFSGPQESAKTLAAYAIGLQVVRHGGTVLIIDFEMGAWDARNRLRELGATPDELQRLPYVEPHEPATDTTIEHLIALRPALVIIDAAAGAYDLQGLDDNKRQDVEKLTRLYIRGFWRASIATIMLDHVVKNTETRGKYAIGSERKVGGADVHLGFEVVVPIKRGGTGVYHIVTHKDRGGFLKRGRLADMHLTSDPDTHQIAWEFRAAETSEQHGDVWMPTMLMEKVCDALAAAPGPLSRNQLEIAVSGKATDKKRAAIDHLTRLGYITETPGPNRSRTYTLNRRFTVSEWENQPDNSGSPGFASGSPGERASGFAGSPPPTGGASEAANEPATQVRLSEPDHETQQLLEHYGLSWVDELAPREQPPADLFDTPNDDLPL